MKSSAIVEEETNDGEVDHAEESVGYVALWSINNEN
jgi:hypothetical protein